MEKEERKSLVVNLYKKLNLAKFKADIEKSADKNSQKDVFHKPRGLRINPKYLSQKQYFQIAEFYVFLHENSSLTDGEIREILNSNNKFSFLRKLDKVIPDFFTELKDHGVMTMATTYVNMKFGKYALNI